MARKNNITEPKPLKTVKVACAQLAIDIDNPADNLRLAVSAIEAALEQGAKIIVLPELASSGYMFNSMDEAKELAEPLDGRTIKGWTKALQGTDAIVIGGLNESHKDGHLYNSVVLVSENGAEHTYRKIHLWGSEQLFFTPGNKPPTVIETVHGKVAVGICYDAYFPELSRAVALAGAQLLVLPTNAPRNIPGEPSPPASFGTTPMQLNIWAGMAHVNGMFVAGCDRCGPERGVEWIGVSAIFDESGLPLATHPADFGPALLLADCVLEKADNKVRGPKNHLLNDRRPEVYPTTGTGAKIKKISII
ncbi:nitrilase-related carbon-nitrogen hydrolase [Colwelliaceae bacterium 6441]